MSIREMYSILTQMPLLQGLNGIDLVRIEERLNLCIYTLEKSRHPFIRQGDTCNELIFLTKGTLVKETLSTDGIYTTKEFIYAPAIIEPEQLYGLTCKYNSSYLVETECRLFNISKKNISSHLMNLEIFRINYMNMLSAQIHKLRERNSLHTHQTPKQKIVTFLCNSFDTTNSEKQIHIKMTDIANYVGETRLTVSSILNTLNEEGIIKLKRNGIIIPSIKELMLP